MYVAEAKRSFSEPTVELALLLKLWLLVSHMLTYQRPFSVAQQRKHVTQSIYSGPEQGSMRPAGASP